MNGNHNSLLSPTLMHIKSKCYLVVGPTFFKRHFVKRQKNFFGLRLWVFCLNNIHQIMLYSVGDSEIFQPLRDGCPRGKLHPTFPANQVEGLGGNCPKNCTGSNVLFFVFPWPFSRADFSSRCRRDLRVLDGSLDPLFNIGITAIIPNK